MVQPTRDATADAGVGAAEICLLIEPWGWREPISDRHVGGFMRLHLSDFGRILDTRKCGDRYNKNSHIHQFK